MGDKCISTFALNSHRKVAYFGVYLGSIYRYDSELDPPNGVLLDGRTDIANVGSIGYDRRDSDSDRSQLAVAILGDYLIDRARVARLYTAFSKRLRSFVSTRRNWIVTESQIERLVEAAEAESQLVWDEISGCYQDESVQETHFPKVLRKTKFA